MNKRILSMLALPLIAMSGAWANGATEGYLPGKFSVSADKQVYFSKGNLQATTTDLGANWTWGFAEHQWDYIGNATANTAVNGNGTVYTNGTVDLFGWVGASSNFEGAAQYGISNSKSINNVNGYGNVATESLKSDWGKVFGDDSPWRTLLSDEWTYLLNTRTTTSGVRYAKACVNGVNGVIIVPDDWNADTYNLQSTNTGPAKYTTNTIDEDTWTNTLERAGAVFLPAVGNRAGSSVGDVGSYGDYWTSSADGANNANAMNFGSSYLLSADGFNRYRGCSVRLVREEISQGSTGDASDPEVTWDATNKQGTFTMPAGNVEVSVEYYPLATCTAPVAKEGILVGAADEIVTAGTPDGGKMYYLMTLANEKPESTEGFTEALPTAQSVTEEGQVYVWYYVDGDAEHSSSDIYADAVPVTLVAPAPGEAHTLTFAAANVFTIEGGKAVVKVNADARPLNENQELTVKAGSTITIEAIPGYKIKSVKVKKGVSPKLPLTMEALTDGTIQVQSPQSGMQYTLNGGEKKAVTADAIEVVAGDKVAFYGNGTQIKYYNSTSIAGGTAQVKLYGNIMSLVDEENFATATELTWDYTFLYLFSGNEQLIDASGLLLPATTLSNECYSGLFQNCKNLTAIPELLPATTLTEECYSRMFEGCSSLTAIPEKLLPATVMAKKCYFRMFWGCASLTTIPENLLPATVMANNCYNQMFYGCSSLTTIPENLLPATVMAESCYSSMFSGCSSLTTVPELPATTLALGCYSSMFLGCTSLTAVSENLLPASTLAIGCYYYMFSGCSSLTVAPVLPAETLVDECYRSMFNNCSNLGSLTCLATSGLRSGYCTDYWLKDTGTNVSGTKTFIAVSGVQWVSGTSGIPSGWTRVDYQP